MVGSGGGGVSGFYRDLNSVSNSAFGMICLLRLRFGAIGLKRKKREIG